MVFSVGNYVLATCSTVLPSARLEVLLEHQRGFAFIESTPLTCHHNVSEPDMNGQEVLRCTTCTTPHERPRLTVSHAAG
eukprot:6478858-Amphidinium_carterae.1